MGKSKRSWGVLAGIVISACLLMCIALPAVSGKANRVFNRITSEAVVGIGQEAPEFELATLSGDVIRLSQYQGQPRLIYFGTSWCPGCRQEASLLQSLHENYPELRVLLVNRNEGPGPVQAFADEFGLTFPIALDRNGKAAKSYRVYGIPSVFFVDGDGIIQARSVGTPLETQLEKALPAVGVTP